MKILLTGANGILGSYLLDAFKSKAWKVGTFKRVSNHNLNFAINDIEAASKLYDVIVHAAANTDVEACERYPEQCFKDNTFFTERLAIAANKNKCKMIYISSTGIYGAGNPTAPYHEYDQVIPTTVHHESKWRGEEAVRTLVNNHLILRVGWLFGGQPTNAKNFVARRIEEALDANEIKSNNTQRGVPTSARQAAYRISELIGRDEIGTYNLVNAGSCSRYQYVREILRIAGISTKIIPIDGHKFSRLAKVSNNETAISTKLSWLGYDPLGYWSNSLEEYINTELRDWIQCQKSQKSQF